MIFIVVHMPCVLYSSLMSPAACNMWKQKWDLWTITFLTQLPYELHIE